MNPNDWILGIDFGTSNTAAAHTNPVKGIVEPINLGHGRTTMSSSVYMEGADEALVGEVALNKAESNPVGFIPSPKRLIPQQVFQLDGYEILSSVPVAAVLRSVIDKASREHRGVEPATLVLTHPEAWSERELDVLTEAARSLGFAEERLLTVSEPQAAATYYAQMHRNAQAGADSAGDADGKVAVFDFGGGTLDVAVLKPTQSKTENRAEAWGNQSQGFEVLAAQGINTIGGKSFDGLIRRWVDRQLEETDPELLDYLRTESSTSERFELDDSIRRAKELLSEASSGHIKVSAGSITARLQLTRDEFESLISPAVDRAVALTQATLHDAGVSEPNQLAALYLTGGSSRVPLVQEKLKELGPVATLDDPKTVVAQGAVLFAESRLGLTANRRPPAQSRNEWTESESAPETAADAGWAVAQPAQSGHSGLATEKKPAQQKPAKKGRAALVAGIVVGVLALGGGAYAVLSQQGSSEQIAESAAETSAAAAGETTENATSTTASSASSAAEASASDKPISEWPMDIDFMKAQLPPQIAESLVECSLQEASDDARWLNCFVSVDSRMATYMKEKTETSGQPHIRFTWGSYASSMQSDLQAAAEDEAVRQEGAQLKSSADRHRIGQVEKAVAGGYYALDYVDADAGYTFYSNDFASAESAMKFLEDFQLV